MIKRLLKTAPVILSALFILISGGCTEQPPDDGSVAVDWSAYTIVIPKGGYDKVEARFTYLAYESFLEAYKTEIGIDPVIAYDTDEPVEYEIIMPGCKRKEAGELEKELRLKDYLITFTGTKFYLAARNAFGVMDAAMLSFSRNYLGMDAIEPGELFRHRGSYLYDTISINGIDISEYTLVYSDLYIVDKRTGKQVLSYNYNDRGGFFDSVQSLSGITLNFVGDTEYDPELFPHAIFIGDCSECEGAAAPPESGMLVCSENGNLAFTGASYYEQRYFVYDWIEENIPVYEDKSGLKLDITVEPGTHYYPAEKIFGSKYPYADGTDMRVVTLYGGKKARDGWIFSLYPDIMCIQLPESHSWKYTLTTSDSRNTKKNRILDWYDVGGVELLFVCSKKTRYEYIGYAPGNRNICYAEVLKDLETGKLLIVASAAFPEDEEKTASYLEEVNGRISYLKSEYGEDLAVIIGVSCAENVYGTVSGFFGQQYVECACAAVNPPDETADGMQSALLNAVFVSGNADAAGQAVINGASIPSPSGGPEADTQPVTLVDMIIN